MPVLAPVSWLLDLALLPEGRQRALDRGAQGAGIDPVRVRALHQHPRASEPVGELERQRARLGVERNDDLVAVVLAQRLDLGGQLLLGRHDEQREVGAALGERVVRAPSWRCGCERRLSLASITSRPRAGPCAASIATTTSPTLPVASTKSPTASATSPWASAIAVDRVGHALLEGPALGAPALALGLELIELLLLEPQRLQLLLELRPSGAAAPAGSRAGAPRRPSAPGSCRP